MATTSESSGGFRRWMIRLLILGILGGGGYYAWTLYDKKTDAPTTYRTATVTRGKLVQAVTATGQLNALVMVQVGSQISGTIEKIHADFNTPVKAGQLVAQLDAATYRAVVAQGEGDLANAEASLELAKLNADRKKELREKQLAPAADYDKAVADLRQAEAQVKIKTASLEKQRVDLARCSIFAPIDGIVISRKVDVGQTVAASFNAPVLFEIANDLGKMQIHANVAEADVGGVAPAQKVEFTVDAFPDQTFKGVVQQVRNAPVTVDNVVTYVTVIDVDNKDLKLKPGMTANVSIILAERADALLVSNAALRFRLPVADSGNDDKGGRGRGEGARGPRSGENKSDSASESSKQQTVHVLAEGSDAAPQPVSITIGITDGVRSEVLNGLNENQNTVIGVNQSAGSNIPNPMGSPFGSSGMRRM
jgi:HlyD family secretion protein